MSITASCLFCDDIREEHTGKEIYIGIYKNALIAQSLPTKMPALCIVVTVRSSIEQSFTVEGLVIEPPDQEKRVLPQKIKVPAHQPGEKTSGAMFRQVTLRQRFENVELLGPGRLKVWAKVDDKEVYAGSLQIVEGVGEQQIDLNSAFAFVSLYKAWKEIREEPPTGLATQLMEEISGILPVEAVPKEDGKGFFIVQRGQHEFRVFYFHPYDQLPNVKVKALPKNLKPKISNLNDFSFDLSFVDADADADVEIEEIDLVIRESR